MFEKGRRNMKTDAIIQNNVISELKWEPSVDASKIGVSVRDGVVTLSGYVDTFIEKTAAERAAKRVSGVEAIAEEIKVKLPQSYERDDADIAEAAANSLEWNVLVPHDKIKVQVEDGMVILTGEVGKAYQRTAAHDAVCCLMGVKGVTNQISISSSVTPVGIKSKIKNALKRHSAIDARDLIVETSGSKVTLSGSVHSWTDKQEAGSAAWAAPGVTDVENNIVVFPASEVHGVPAE
jgi:osmotically-inducible protein OsmY